MRPVGAKERDQGQLGAARSALPASAATMPQRPARVKENRGTARERQVWCRGLSLAFAHAAGSRGQIDALDGGSPIPDEPASNGSGLASGLQIRSSGPDHAQFILTAVAPVPGAASV